MKATLTALTVGTLLAGSAAIAAADQGWRHDGYRGPPAKQGWDRGGAPHRDFYGEHGPVRPGPYPHYQGHYHGPRWYPHDYRPYWRHGHDGYRYGTYPGGYGHDEGSITVILNGGL